MHSTLVYTCRPPSTFDIHMWMMSLSSNLIWRAFSFCQLTLVDTLYILTKWRIQVCYNISTVTSTNLTSGWNPYRHPSSDTITALGTRDRSWALLQQQCLIYPSLLSSSQLRRKSLVGHKDFPVVQDHVTSDWAGNPFDWQVDDARGFMRISTNWSPL